MTLYDKNDVRIEDPYSISHEEDTYSMIACQRCGHTQLKQKGIVCKACNHPIPQEKPRQTWSDVQKNSYLEMAEVFFGDPQKPNKEFRKSRSHGYMWQVGLRNFGLTMSMAALIVFPAVMGFRAYVGESTWKVVEGKVSKWVAKEKTSLLKVVNQAPKKANRKAR